MSYIEEGHIRWRTLGEGINREKNSYYQNNFKRGSNSDLGFAVMKMAINYNPYKEGIIVVGFKTHDKIIVPDDPGDETLWTWMQKYPNSEYVWKNGFGKDEYTEPTGEWSAVLQGPRWYPFKGIRENVDGASYFDTTNFPLYDFSKYGNSFPPQEAFNGINKYIESGDITDADNYAEISQWQVLVKVWLDGKYPNLYIRPTKNSSDEPPQGTLDNLSVGIRSTVDLAGDRTYLQLQSGNTSYVSYNSYEDTTQIIGTTKYYFKVYDLGIEKVKGLFTVNKDGTIGETTSGISTHYLIEFYPNSTPGDNAYPESNDDKWNIEPTTNEFSGANTLTKTYEISNQGVVDLGIFMWNSNFKDNIFGLIQSPIENIVSLKAMPISGVGTTSEKIKIGNVQSSIDGNVVPYADGIKISVGSIKIPRLFHNFIDFSSINIMVYLPFIGFKQLDPVLYVNRTIWLDYVYDTIYGNVLAILSVADKTGVKLVHDVYQGNCGIDIAITSTNRGQIESGYVRGALSTVNDVLSGNLLGAANDVYNSMSQQFHSQSNGVGNASLMNKMDMTARIIIKRPQFFTPNNYGHIFGYPCHQYKTIAEFTDENFNTFVKCENFVCSELENATDEEKDELKQLMEQGVYA